MPNISLGLEIKADGIPQTVGDIKKAQSAIAAMKKEAATFNAVGKAFGTTDAEAKKLAQSMGKTAEETLDLVNAMKDLKSLQVDAATRFQVLSKGANLTANQFETLEKQLGTTNKELNDFQKLGGAIASAGIAAKVAEIGKASLATGLKFEGLQSTLETTLGSKAAANQVFGRLQTFAADTPNQLDEVVQAFISLKQRGIEPTNDVLTKFGDIAASQGKPLQQFIEAVLDATTGENERLKEFGIAAKTSGDKVTFSFQGINKTVEKTPQAIQGALLAFGALDGVTGGMAKKAATLGGQFSNLQDNSEALQNELFGLVQGPMIEVVTQANTLINYFRELPAPLQLTVLGIAGLSGALVAAVAAVTAFNLANGQAIVTKTVESAALIKNTIATNALAASKLIAAAATGTLTEAQLASISAMAGVAVTAGLVVGALASIALAVDTFNKVTESARETEKATANLEKSLASLTEIEKKHADAAGEAAANLSLEAAALERTQKQLGPIQNGLDVLRNLLNTISLGHLLKEFAKLDFVPEPLKNLLNALGNVLPKVTTAAEESLREQAVAFEEQATKADEISGKVFSLFSKGAKKLTDNELKLYKSAVDEATAAIKDHIPIDEQDSNLKANKLTLLAKSKTLIDAETAAREKSKKAIEGAAAAEQKATEDAAKKQANTLKSQQDAAKEKENKQFEERSRDRAEKAAQEQRDRTEQFNDLQRNADEKFQAIQENAKEQFQNRLQADQEDFQSKENQSKELFQRQQQSTEDAFQSRQNQAQEAFQLRQNQAQEQFEERIRQQKERTATAFTDAQRKASEAEQLASAKTSSEREKLTAEFNRQARQREAISKLQLADREFNPQEILKMAREVSKANLSTADGAQRVNAAIQAIQAEQQKQQEEADRQTKIAFEKALQDERKGFELAQQVAKKDFEKQQQEGQKAFELEQQQSKKTFQAQQQEEQKAFEVQQQEQDKAYQELKRQLDKTIAESERQIQRSHEDEGRAIQKAFNERERLLDKENAEAVKKILESAKAQGGVQVQARRSGGPVAPGEPYLVGEEGPELIIPRSPGQVMTARQTAAMMSLPSVGIAATPSISLNTRTLETQSAKMVKLLGDANATLNKMATTKPAVPPPVEFPKEKPIFENWGGLPL